MVIFSYLVDAYFQLYYFSFFYLGLQSGTVGENSDSLSLDGSLLWILSHAQTTCGGKIKFFSVMAVRWFAQVCPSTYLSGTNYCILITNEIHL